jgi:hypothetical protein
MTHGVRGRAGFGNWHPRLRFFRSLRHEGAPACQWEREKRALRGIGVGLPQLIVRVQSRHVFYHRILRLEDLCAFSEKR